MQASKWGGFIRKQNPLQSRFRWRWWHTLLLLLVGVAVLLTIFLTGDVADFGARVVGNQDWFMRIRVTVVIVLLYGLLGVRAVPWWRVVSYLLIVIGLLSNIARNEFSGNPLTMSFLLLLTGVMVEGLATTIRLNMQEKLHESERENDLLEVELDGLLQVKQDLEDQNAKLSSELETTQMRLQMAEEELARLRGARA